MRTILHVFLLAVAALPALAGEVIGNTYISEKDGVIEVAAEDWEIKDVEQPGAAQIARFDLKSTPQAGFTASALLFRVGSFGGVLKPEAIINQLRGSLESKGAEVSPMEARRFAGKRVLAFSYVMQNDQGKANGQAYSLEGPKAIYWFMCSSNVRIWEHAQKKCDELIEKTKY